MLKEEERLNSVDYIYTCSVCSLDEELWPYGSIKSNKYNVAKGCIPCGCSKSPKYTEDQWKIRIERECVKKGYIFEGFVGKFKANRSKIRLYNPETGNRWESFTISNFINHGQEDPSLRSSKLSKRKIVPDDIMINRFFDKGGFTDGYIFCRGDKTKDGGFYWKYYCPYCSNDSFVEEGLCSGIFESYVSSLLVGSKACRCSNTIYDEDSFKMSARNLLKEKGYVFKGLAEEFKGYTTKVKWECKEGYKNSHTLPHLRRNAKCSVCNASNSNGFYYNRGNDKDYLYVVDLGFDEYFKIGRTFNLKQRITSLKRQYCTDSVNLIQVFEGSHEDVYKIEQKTLYTIKDAGLNYLKDKERELVKKEGVDFTIDVLSKENRIFEIELDA